MFVLRHVSLRQLRLLRPQLVPPFSGAVLLLLLVVSACPATIKASSPSPVQHINAESGHKSQPLTSGSSDSATTPSAIQLPLDRLTTADYRPAAEEKKQRFRRNAFGLDYSAGLTDLRKYLNSDCVQYEHRTGGVVGERTSGDSDGTVVKTIPCNHRMKYLDDQWEDMLYAEEPDYIVVRRDTDTAGPENNEGMEFIPIRGRKKEKPAAAVADGLWWRHGMQSSEDIGPQTAAAAAGVGSRKTDRGDVVVVPQSKRDSRQSSQLPNTLWPVAPTYVVAAPTGGRGKKGRIDKILSKEDFLPNRGKKLLLEYLRRQRSQEEGLVFPKRGKKTRHYPKNTNSRPTDLMWLTKDDFFPHRGKKFDNSFSYLDDPAADYYGDVPPAAAAEEEDSSYSNVPLNGVILSGSRDSISMGRQNRELLSNLSKQEPRDKWRGRKRSVQADTAGHYDNAKPLRRSTTVVVAAPSLNENNGEDVAPNTIDEDSDGARPDQRPRWRSQGP